MNGSKTRTTMVSIETVVLFTHSSFIRYIHHSADKLVPVYEA